MEKKSGALNGKEIFTCRHAVYCKKHGCPEPHPGNLLSAERPRLNVNQKGKLESSGFFFDVVGPSCAPPTSLDSCVLEMLLASAPAKTTFGDEWKRCHNKFVSWV